MSIYFELRKRKKFKVYIDFCNQKFILIFSNLFFEEENSSSNRENYILTTKDFEEIYTNNKDLKVFYYIYYNTLS